MSRTFIVTTILCLCAICGVRAQIVKNGSRWWDGKALYTATVDQEGDIVMNGITQVDGKKKFCLAKADAAGTYYLTKDNPDAEMPVNGKMGNKVVCVKEGANTFLRVLNRNREVTHQLELTTKAFEAGAGNDYGQEAISTILKRMEDYRDRLVVIVAGYKNEMQRFIDSNPGLQSRFNRYIDFPDYTGGELSQIFKMYMKKNQYTLSAEAEKYLKERFEYAVAHKDRNFGNARYARNVFEKSIQAQANRLADEKSLDKDKLTELTVDDLKGGFASRANI